jgi:hypothetical protein
MNQELWDSLNSKIAERGHVQAQLEELRIRGEQLGVEIEQLASTLQADLAQLRSTPEG